jgi:DNA invertase Pin-like site-specific DNA recombinase
VAIHLDHRSRGYRRWRRGIHCIPAASILLPLFEEIDQSRNALLAYCWGSALQALLAEVRARKIDVVVVYKVDRLTRSLADFAVK